MNHYKKKQLKMSVCIVMFSIFLPFTKSINGVLMFGYPLRFIFIHLHTMMNVPIEYSNFLFRLTTVNVLALLINILVVYEILIVFMKIMQIIKKQTIGRKASSAIEKKKCPCHSKEDSQ